MPEAVAPPEPLRPISGGRPEQSWLSLLILQASPFCNVNCDYCYLPGRTSRNRMSFETLRAAVNQVFSTDLVSREITIVWHAGEPLAVPLEWYREAFRIIEETKPSHIQVRHSFQTNATLITEDWCRFFREHRTCVGVSIDGPTDLHDLHRRTRSGRGTHAAAMRGVSALQRHGIPVHVISVVTRQALSQPDAIYDFFRDAGLEEVGFNIEEQEGANQSSSLAEPGIELVRSFFTRLFERQAADGGKVRIREFENARAHLLMGNGRPAGELLNDQVRPFGILSIDWEGNFATYSPELLGFDFPELGKFAFGNVHNDALLAAAQTGKFQTVLNAVQAGVAKCRETCAFFGVCGGGSPGNKYFENGSFDSTETFYCRTSVQIPFEIVLRAIETDHSVPGN